MQQLLNRNPSPVKNTNKRGDRANLPVRTSLNTYYNFSSIILSLTGLVVEDFSKISQVNIAKAALEKALSTEQKKARMSRYDYEPNRHVALHQAYKKIILLEESLYRGQKPAN